MVGPDDDESVRALIEDMALATPPATMSALFELIGDYPLLSGTLPSLVAPILFLSGEDDPALDRTRLATLAAGLDNARLAFVLGAGHLPVLSSPHKANEALLAFWNDLDMVQGVERETVA